MRLYGTLIVLSFVLAAGAAHAADGNAEAARQHYNKAVQLYDLGHFEEAIGEFEKAYESKQDPVLLYNLAQSYRRLGNHKQALDLYRNFLLRMPGTPYRTDVEARIASLQKLVAEEAAEAPPAPGPAPAPSSTTPPVALPPAPLVATAPATTTPTGRDGRGLRIAGWASAGAGVVAVTGGVLFGLRARSLSQRVTDAPIFQASDESSGKTAARMQWVCYGAGAALLATGAVLFFLGRPRAASASPAVAVAPALFPAGAGLVTEGTF
jgi:tetratricopeptide (TPR) repeat protein